MEYLDVVVHKVELVGNCPYPEHLSSQKLYGNVLLSFQINSDGNLNEVEIKRSSGNEQINKAAIMLIRKASPFPRFPPELFKITDFLEITRMVTFAKVSDDLEYSTWYKNLPCKDATFSAVKTR